MADEDERQPRDVPATEINLSQEPLEYLGGQPPESNVCQTAEHLEWIQQHPLAIVASQVCLEVLFPSSGIVEPPPASRRNHTFWAIWLGTGHGDNASFEG